MIKINVKVERGEAVLYIVLGLIKPYSTASTRVYVCVFFWKRKFLHCYTGRLLFNKGNFRCYFTSGPRSAKI